MSFGGRSHSNVKLLMGNEADFGGVASTLEDGII